MKIVTEVGGVQDPAADTAPDTGRLLLVRRGAGLLADVVAQEVVAMEEDDVLDRDLESDVEDRDLYHDHQDATHRIGVAGIVLDLHLGVREVGTEDVDTPDPDQDLDPGHVHVRFLLALLS